MKLTLEQMRVYKLVLAAMDSKTLAEVVTYNRDCATALPSHPWSFYHLARDEQINRIQIDVGVTNYINRGQAAVRRRKCDVA
jgi:hypothetical protein